MIGREKELIYLKNGFSANGTLRCSFISGVDGIGKTTLIEETCHHLLESGNHLLISANGQECETENDLLSHFTRNLLASKSLEINESLNLFARTVGGKLLTQTNPPPQQDNTDSNDPRAFFFINKLSEVLKDTKATPIVIIDDLDSLSEQTLLWLSTEFNKALRNSPQFKTCRFLFSSSKEISDFDEFWARFGFENPVDLPLQALSLTEVGELASSKGYEGVPIGGLTQISKGTPALVLKHLQNGFIMNTKENNMDVSVNDQNIDLSGLPEKELEYLLYASYPAKINRYNLEHFCSPKHAAFTYNWLKRRSDFCEPSSGGDLIIKPSIKQQMRAFHLEQEPQKAEQMATLASVLDAFYKEFPDTENHWIPINLQIFNTFTKSLLKKVFDEYENEELTSFLTEHEGILVKRGKFYSLSDDSRQLISRYMELSGSEIKENLLESVNRVWEEDQVEFRKRKVNIESEQTDLNNEISDIQSQITHFQGLKKNIEDKGNNPQRSKLQRIVTFNMSMTLVVFGLVVVGASLLSDMLGAYHAACGLAVTIFGFFWPNVEIRNVNPDGSVSTSNLAIETQQRSLEHRINGLLGRANSIALNLENLSKEAQELEDGSAEPYIVKK